MGQRGYAETFYSHYFKNTDGKTRLQKAAKIAQLMRMICPGLEELDCLDLGCSNGIITASLTPVFRSVIGLDYDLVGLSLISEPHKKSAGFLRGDAMTLPFAAQSFGAVICAQVYEHVPDDEKLFKEILRVTRHTGIVFFSGPNKIFPIEPHYFIPFLHWMPQKTASQVLRWTRKAQVFDIRSRTFWALRKMLSAYEIFDMTIPMLRISLSNRGNLTGGLLRFLLRLLKPLIKVLTPFNPNFNWILKSPGSGVNSGQYHVLD